MFRFTLALEKSSLCVSLIEKFDLVDWLNACKNCDLIELRSKLVKLLPSSTSF
jgi:hypothetical protein